MPDSTDDAPRVTIERDGHVLLIGINRAHKRNAMDLKALDALADAYLLLDQDPDLRVGVVFGHGDHFSAGLDLAEVGPAVAVHGPAALAGSSVRVAMTRADSVASASSVSDHSCVQSGQTYCSPSK